MLRRILIIVAFYLILLGCGVQENATITESGNTPIKDFTISTQIIQEANTETRHEVVSEMVTSTFELMPIPTPMYDNKPMLKGNRYVLDTRAFAAKHDAVVEINLGQEIQMTRPRSENPYSIDFDKSKITIVTPDNQITLPSEEGWLWKAHNVGQTRITITTAPPCNATPDACLSLPLITYSVIIDVK